MKQGTIYIECNFEKTPVAQVGEVVFSSEAKNIYLDISKELFELCGVSKFYRAHEKKCIDTIAYILKSMVKAILSHQKHLVGKLGFKMFVLRDTNWLSKQGLAAEFSKILELMKQYGYIDDEINGFNNKRKPSESTKGYILFRYANIEKIVDAVRFLFKEKKQKPVKNNPYVDIRERGISISRKKDKNGIVRETEFETWVPGDLTQYKNQKELNRIIRQTRKIEDFIKKPTYSIPIRDNFSNDDERIDYILSYSYNERIKDNNDISLCRIFHKDLQHYGRYYGKQHYYIPKEYRQKILIDGQKTIQLDFKSCVPSILYIMSGNKLEKNQGLYHVENLEIPREYLKYIFVCALNSPSEFLHIKQYEMNTGEIQKYFLTLEKNVYL